MLPDVKELAFLLLKIIQKDDIQIVFKDNAQTFYSLSMKIWNRKPVEDSSLEKMRLADKALNSTTGIILWCWIDMIVYSDQCNLCDPYRTKLEEILQTNEHDRDIIVFILAGHFNLFYHKDRKWCESTLIPLLDSNDKITFASAWAGIVHLSRRINKDTADIMAPLYLSAAKKMNWMNDDSRIGFIDLYLTLLIFVIDKPTLKYIPVFYRSASEKGINEFINAIGQRLRNMDYDSQIKWWNNWLRRFLENRKSNKPVELSESECNALFMLLPKLSFAVDDAVKVLCKGKLPTYIDHMFWYKLSESKLSEAHPQSIAKLIIALLGSLEKIGYESNYIKTIAQNLHGLSESEKSKMHEVLLKHNIDVVLI